MSFVSLSLFFSFVLWCASAPQAEFWCNEQYLMCDGFDQPSNVWGLSQAVLFPLANASAAAVLAPPAAARVAALLDAMMARAKAERPTAAALERAFAALLADAGGAECVDAYQDAGGLARHLRDEPLPFVKFQ